MAAKTTFRTDQRHLPFFLHVAIPVRNKLSRPYRIGFHSAIMPNQIHGHQVMEMMTSSNQLYTRNSLKATIIAKFGADARFHTCSAENLDADALIDFLADHGKFRENTDGLAIDAAKVCNH